MILPGQTIGILGGGQLGRMMAIAAKEMGYNIAVLEPNENSSCAQVADVEVITAYDDLNGAKQLADASHVITYEFENINGQTAKWLEENAYLPQGSQLLTITQDRKIEKKAINEAGIETVPYKAVASKTDLHSAADELGFPSVLKTARGGYDGKGQVVLRGESDFPEALQLLKNNECVLEKWLAFEKELSVIVTRSVTGETAAFPVAENIHVNNILHQSIVPAKISKDIEEKAKKIALHLADAFHLVGTLAVEMFLSTEGELFVNELAPRPHNSGHYTIDACETSQFQQHIRAVCGWPLGRTELLKPVVMVNILGQHVEKTLASIDKFNDCKLHLYGKGEAKHNRKMGHINVLAETVEQALEKIKELQIWTD
ncbi:5-(carboxyamino)imidazole ribonucleotide synthase [Pueribacillus theae]|uniref:N5-carboxyaminoimidazole ribonucleotide synthase n=1 Tax=Pueribacillus theae TaxID=2171751 RepID=A0A2U1JZE7_9BACI|nr:5-(carboxyamino)imidazole ribonucleotide synthase [Pueribacillus theae]PWA10319.1 5-(carboxyamino)imidazole ribonucleotide synthase [Pueribacillus theae]